MATTSVPDAAVFPQDDGTGVAGGSEDHNSAGWFGTIARNVGPGGYRETGCRVANVDTSNETCDVTGGAVFVADTTAADVQGGSGTAYDTALPVDHVYGVVLPTDVTGLALGTDAWNTVYLSVDPTAQDSVTLHHGPTVSAPSDPHIKLGRANTGPSGAVSAANPRPRPGLWETPDGATTAGVQEALNQDGNLFVRLEPGTVYSGSSTLELDPIDSNGDARTIVLDARFAAVEHTGSSVCVDILDFLDSNGDPTDGRVRIYGGYYGGAPGQPVIRCTDIFNPIIHFQGVGAREGEGFSDTVSDGILLRNVDHWSEVPEIRQMVAADEAVYDTGRCDTVLHFQGANATGGSGTRSFREALIDLMWVDAANNGSLVWSEGGYVSDAEISLGGWLPEGGNGILLDSGAGAPGSRVLRMSLEGGDADSVGIKADSGPLPIVLNSRITNDDATEYDIDAAANLMELDTDGVFERDTGRGVEFPPTENSRANLTGAANWYLDDSGHFAFPAAGQFVGYDGNNDGVELGYDLSENSSPYWEMQSGAAFLRDPGGLGNAFQFSGGGYPQWTTNPVLHPELSADPGFDVDDGQAAIYCSDGSSGVTGGDDDVVVAARRAGVGPVNRILFDTEPASGTVTVAANSTEEVATGYAAGAAFAVEYWIDSDPNGAPRIEHRLGYDDAAEEQTVVFEETNGTGVDLGYEFPETGR